VDVEKALRCGHEAGRETCIHGKDVISKGCKANEQSPLCRIMVISGAFAVMFFRMRVRLRCPVLQVSIPEIHYKTAEIIELAIL